MAELNTNQVQDKPQVQATMPQTYGSYPITAEEMEQRRAAYQQQQEMKKQQGIKRFQSIGLTTLIYAIIMTICLYKNFSGITMVPAVIATIWYVRSTAAKLGAKGGCGWIFYAGGMVLLGIGDMITANHQMQWFSNIMMFVLLVGMVLYLFRQQIGWSLEKYLLAFCQAVFGAIGVIGELFSDMKYSLAASKNEKTKTKLYILIGIAIFIPIGILVLALLSSADVVFHNLINDVLLKYILSENIVLFPGFFALLFAGAYCGMTYIAKGEIKEECVDHRTGPILIINTVLIPLSLIYVLFCGVQVNSLFLKNMELPSNYTYAEYAREGFFQLLFVCFLNLIIVLIAKGFFKEHMGTKLLLTLISLCTYVMLASSAFRLLLYIQAYNLTMLRIQVIFALVVLALCLLLIMISVYVKKLPLMHALTFVVVASFLVMLYSKPDLIIAKYNLSHINQETDYDYLVKLSADAAEEIYSQEGDWVQEYVINTKEDVEKRNFLQYNFSRENARKVMNKDLYKLNHEIRVKVINDSTGDISDIGYETAGDVVRSGGSIEANGDIRVYHPTYMQKEGEDDSFLIDIEEEDLKEDISNGDLINIDFTINFLNESGERCKVSLKKQELEVGAGYSLLIQESYTDDYHYELELVKDHMVKEF